ncbi:MAG: hypothetical protein WB771_01265 [Solirubrobacterales bacterium]
MEASPQPAARPAAQPAGRSHRGIVITLTIVASILAFLAVFAVWANRQLLETDTWTNTSSKLLEDPEIRSQLADYMVDTLYANVDVQGELQTALPPRLQPLAGPAAAGIRELAIKLANQALERPRVQQLWEDANRAAQEKLLYVVEHGGSQPVTLDVGTIVGQLGQQLGVNAAGKIPPGVADIQIASNDQLVKVNKALDLLKTLAWVLTVLALALFGLAIYLARGWRREALRAVGFAFIAVGILVLAARSLAGNIVVNAVASTEAVKPAAGNAWSIGTSLLNDQGGAMIFYGLFIVLGAWLAGPMGFARSARRAITPILERRTVAYSTLAILLVLLFWWGPTPGFHRLPTALLLVVLLVVGTEFLRRQAIRDFPEQKWDGATERWGASLRSRFSRS